MKLPTYMQPQTEWVQPEEYPDLRSYDEIAIDLETKDPELKSKGSGAIMTMETWFKNHFHKNDWRCLHGEIRKDQSGKMNMICEKLTKGGV